MEMKIESLVYCISKSFTLQSYECEYFTIIVSDSAINFYGFHYNEKWCINCIHSKLYPWVWYASMCVIHYGV